MSTVKKKEKEKLLIFERSDVYAICFFIQIILITVFFPCFTDYVRGVSSYKLGGNFFQSVGIE